MANKKTILANSYNINSTQITESFVYDPKIMEC